MGLGITGSREYAANAQLLVKDDSLLRLYIDNKFLTMRVQDLAEKALTLLKEAANVIPTSGDDPPLKGDVRHGCCFSFKASIRGCHHVPLSVCPFDSGPFDLGGSHGVNICENRRRRIQTDGQILGQDLSHQFCRGNCDRHHSGVSVRHKLGGLFKVRRGYLRVALGN